MDGAWTYQDNATAADKVGGAVPPGQTYTYIWQVPERAGPGPNDPSSIVWLYHSHTSERRDVNSGLVGTIVVTRKGMARPDGTPKDVDREFSTMFMIFHTPHWHGNVVMDGGKRTEVIAWSPAQMVTVDMVPDDPGIWLYHCHVSEHMEAGMMARYQVLAAK